MLISFFRILGSLLSLFHQNLNKLKLKKEPFWGQKRALFWALFGPKNDLFLSSFLVCLIGKIGSKICWKKSRKNTNKLVFFPSFFQHIFSPIFLVVCCFYAALRAAQLTYFVVPVGAFRPSLHNKILFCVRRGLRPLLTFFRGRRPLLPVGRGRRPLPPFIILTANCEAIRLQFAQISAAYLR